MTTLLIVMRFWKWLAKAPLDKFWRFTTTKLISMSPSKWWETRRGFTDRLRKRSEYWNIWENRIKTIAATSSTCSTTSPSGRRSHSNSAPWVTHYYFRSHTCITFELLSINLYELIKKNKFQGFSLQLVRKFAHSLLQCLDTLYRNKIIHCDMKPENVLLKQQGRSGIKVG